MVEGSQTDAPAALPPGKNPATHLTADWMVPRARLGVLGGRNISCPGQDPNPRLSNRTDNATPAPGKLRMRLYYATVGNPETYWHEVQFMPARWKSTKQ